MTFSSTNADCGVGLHSFANTVTGEIVELETPSDATNFRINQEAVARIERLISDIRYENMWNTKVPYRSEPLPTSALTSERYSAPSPVRTATQSKVSSR